jgi:hypothetical protein
MKTMCAMVSLAVGVGGAAMVAAPQQRPGDPTPAKVWVQNRETAERIPVSLREVGGDVVVRTQVTALPALTLSPGTVVTTRAMVQPWDYRSLVIPIGTDPAPALRALGSEGWETTDLMFPVSGGTQVLLKRPRP